MADPIPQAEIANGLDLAASLGVIRGWTHGRGRGRDGRTNIRWFEIVFHDGDVVRWPPAGADAFATGVRETARVLAA